MYWSSNTIGRGLPYTEATLGFDSQSQKGSLSSSRNKLSARSEHCKVGPKTKKIKERKISYASTSLILSLTPSLFLFPFYFCSFLLSVLRVMRQ